MCSTRYLSPSTSNNESTEILEEVSHISKYSTFLIFPSGRLSARLDLDAFQIGESTCRELLFHCGLRQSLNSVINLGKRIALV